LRRAPGFTVFSLRSGGRETRRKYILRSSDTYANQAELIVAHREIAKSVIAIAISMTRATPRGRTGENGGELDFSYRFQRFRVTATETRGSREPLRHVRIISRCWSRALGEFASLSLCLSLRLFLEQPAATAGRKEYRACSSYFSRGRVSSRVLSLFLLDII